MYPVRPCNRTHSIALRTQPPVHARASGRCPDRLQKRPLRRDPRDEVCGRLRYVPSSVSPHTPSRATWPAAQHPTGNSSPHSVGERGGCREKALRGTRQTPHTQLLVNTAHATSDRTRLESQACKTLCEVTAPRGTGNAVYSSSGGELQIQEGRASQRRGLAQKTDFCPHSLCLSK